MSCFVSMREYVSGDDPRLIHWPTTARTGQLMVREHVEVRRPEFTIVVDTAAASGDPESFEEIVDVAATLAVHALRTGLEVVVRTNERSRSGQPTPLHSEADVLELLTPVAQTSGTDLIHIGELFTHGFDHTSVVLLTGADGPSSRVAGAEQMIVVRIGESAVPATGISMTALDATDFVNRWRAWS